MKGKYVKTTLGFICICISMFFFVMVLYRNSKYSQVTRTFSPYTLLHASWEEYKLEFINSDGRVVDESQKGITTSEGQSYALLRAVWLDDRETFDRVWNWTKNNLDRPSDKLLGWKWGKLENNAYGFLPDGGQNPASDADQDIALALLLANRRWKEPAYKADALPLLKDIWTIETDVAGGKRYLIAGDWARNAQQITVNPSYFAPYAWKIFAKEDTQHNWESLVDPAYTLLNQLSNLPLDKQKSIGLAPNWVIIQKSSGTIQPTNTKQLTTDYGYDAIRVPFRIALDYQWTKETRARTYLEKSSQFLKSTYQENNMLSSGYSHDGKPLQTYENASLYATALGYFIVTDKQLAQKIYEEKVLKLYSTKDDTFNKNLPYYEQNWLWFGAALYNKFLVPFT